MAQQPIRDKSPKKASFKCSGYRNRKKLPTSTVQELTRKFNQIAAAQGKTSNFRMVIYRSNKKPKFEPTATTNNCLPVKSAIDYFEGKPVATIKPIIKENALDKPPTKPKLAPKDSLCRSQYNNMRRPKLSSPDRKNSEKEVFEKISQTCVIAEGTPTGQRKFASLLINNKNDEKPSVETQMENLLKTKIDLTKISENRIVTTCRTVTERRFASLLNDSTVKDLKPNTSFLWSKKPTSAQKPLPKPPENFPSDLFYERIPTNESDDSDFDENIYDDISSRNNVRNLNESLYCISDQLSDKTFNIYEDIQSLRLAVKSSKKPVFYDYTDSVVYESIYNENSLLVGSDISSEHTGSDRINSLYGALPLCQVLNDESTRDIESSLNRVETDPVNTSDMCSSSNSDEWIEISESESDETIYIYQPLDKCKKKSAKKARWSKLQKKALQKLSQEEVQNEDHVYECISTQDESASAADSQNNSITTTTTTTTNDDSVSIDDFESSEDECPDTQLPAEPAVQYKLAKSLRAAGQKIRKNLTLRKSDLGLSLKKLRPRLRSETFDKSPQTPHQQPGSTFYCDIITPNKEVTPQVSSTPIRPSDPPPPPPPVYQSSPSMDNSVTSSSGDTVKYADLKLTHELYKESGVFSSGGEAGSKHKSISSSVYSEVGLYGTNSELQKSGQDTTRGKLFADEPLYQFYTECVNAQARDDILKHYDSDGYEAINDYYQLVNDKRRTLDVKVPGPNLQDFAGPDIPEPKQQRPSFCVQTRSLWCQMPDVEKSCIVATLTNKQRQLQEAKFEILTSEGSYMHSLTVLENHFMPKLSCHLTIREQRLLFSNSLSVKAESELLLTDLELCWTDDIMLTGICDIVLRHAKDSFGVYMKFCKHHRAMYVTLRSLIDSNQAFASTLRELESSPVCQNLSLHSFLLLPIQRITRMPLLLGAVLARLQPDDQEYESCKSSLDFLNQVVSECDEEARRMEKCEEMLVLSQQLDFREGIRRIPIISGSRHLVKRGSATLLGSTKHDYKPDTKLTFGRRVPKMQLTLLLFTDMLVIARNKGGRTLLVMDYCPRNLVQLEIPENINYLNNSSHKHLMMLTLLENHESKTAEMIIGFELESDRQRWIEAVCPKLSGNPEESIYEEWDCPQVIAIYEFTAAQPDELSICIGDIVNVLKKIPDGWYQGERLRDGARGWFPGNYTQEISSAHVRAKNKKQRYKLLSLSGNYIQQCQNKLSGLS